jgi:hypothetical protein
MECVESRSEARMGPDAQLEEPPPVLCAQSAADGPRPSDAGLSVLSGSDAGALRACKSLRSLQTLRAPYVSLSLLARAYPHRSGEPRAGFVEAASRTARPEELLTT